MPCYSPIAARRNGSGGVELLGSVHDPAVGRLSTLRIACGRCVGCRLKYSQMWAIRCVHEASLYDRNCVVTLTYDDKHLPADGSLAYVDFQLFMKRLRQFRRRFFLREHFHLKRFTDLSLRQARCLVELSRIRFYCGGEYGEVNLRPHFHAALFNFDFSDKTALAKKGYFHSCLADETWGLGHVLVGEMSFDSAAYIAGYIHKKIFGDLADDHYRRGTPEELEAEFSRMSRRPGIGMPWLRKYWRETVRDLSVLSKGRRVHMPRLYSQYVESIADCSDARLELEKRMKVLDARPARLLAGAAIASARLGLSRRKL